MLSEREVALYLLPWVYVEYSRSCRRPDRKQSTPIVTHCLGGWNEAQNCCYHGVGYGGLPPGRGGGGGLVRPVWDGSGHDGWDSTGDCNGGGESSWLLETKCHTLEFLSILFLSVVTHVVF